jgi:ADP-ribosylglycohydrolase
MELHEIQEYVREEINQRRDEGDDVAAYLSPVENAKTVEDWRTLYEDLSDPRRVPAESGAEPSALEGIRLQRPDGPRRLAVDEAALPDRMLGAWRGRIAGCVLGKPVEGKSKAYIDRYLAAAGMADLDTFFPRLEPWPADVEDALLHHPAIAGCFEGRITEAQRDDDIDYTILGLHIIEKYGPGFTSRQVADEWLELLPFHQVYTAERVAYKNLVNDIPPPASARTNNPFREWIGAQIRADAFGYVNAGNPERAAEFAYRDAAVSHVRNGIYGEMWSAATIAAAFVTDDVREALEIGLSEIPRNSRLAEAGRKALKWSREFPPWEECWNRARKDYGGLNWVHTINNALWVILGLLYGEKDFGRTIAIAVRCGDDTDCNGATAGSILGAMLGADALPERWTAPFHDRVRSYVTGFDGSRVSDLAARTIAQHERLRDA